MSSATDTEIRRIVADALEGTSVSAALRGDPRLAAFLEGEADVPIAELGMDSLDVMEFCISIELSTGVSVVPGDLQELGTLAKVADAIRTRRA